jgi:hypothetical protein
MYRFLDVDRGWLWFRYPLGVISGEVLMALPKPANRDGKIGASGSLVIYRIIHAWHQLFLVVPKEPIK